jgi:hypothetical protein
VEELISPGIQERLVAKAGLHAGAAPVSMHDVGMQDAVLHTQHDTRTSAGANP